MHSSFTVIIFLMNRISDFLTLQQQSLLCLTYIESRGWHLQWWLIWAYAGNCMVRSYLFLSMHRKQVQRLVILRKIHW